MSLELRAVGKRFGGLEVLRGVSLRCELGEFLAVVGPSGCGKSTLLRLVAGLEQPSSGEVFFGGAAVREPGAERALVLQERALYPWLTLEASVALGLELARRPRREARQTARVWLARLGLEGFEGYYPHQVSGGMAQRAALAQVLAVEPRLLLLDEPFGSLDALTRLGLQAMLQRLWAELGFGVVMVTHDVDEALYLADRVAVLGPRPTSVLACLRVNLPRPRSRDDTGFVGLRREVLALLGVQAEAETPRRKQTWR